MHELIITPRGAGKTTHLIKRAKKDTRFKILTKFINSRNAIRNVIDPSHFITYLNANGELYSINTIYVNDYFNLSIEDRYELNNSSCKLIAYGTPIIEYDKQTLINIYNNRKNNIVTPDDMLNTTFNDHYHNLMSMLNVTIIKLGYKQTLYDNNRIKTRTI